MQLSARILTALAVLAFAVAIIAGYQNANTEVSAATGTIDALNVGTCTTNNADVFDIGNCSQRDAFYQGDNDAPEELEDLIEVENLYATYAHDPKTAAEAPRAIIQDGDLIRISITDKGRDRRDPVLITSSDPGFVSDGVDGNPFEGTYAPEAIPPTEQKLRVTQDDASTEPVNEAFDAVKVVSDELFGADDADTREKLPPLEQVVKFTTGDTNAISTFRRSGSYEIVFTPPGTEGFKPIARDGKVKFFGRVDDDAEPGSTTFGEFREIGDYVKLDEDVVTGEGEDDPQPSMTLNVSVPNGAQDAIGVQLQLIYYETSDVEYIQGGLICNMDQPHERTGNAQYHAMCSSDDLSDDGNFVLYAESDEDVGESNANLALVETGRFTGVFQGYLRLTDADGDGRGVGATPLNWGRMKQSAVYDPENDADLDVSDGEVTNPSTAVIGVNSGPISITYRDTNGKNVTFEIEIDIDPPTIQIDSPVNGSRSDDEKPSFIGSVNDSDSGLVSESFQLNVDNRDDEGDDEPVMKIDVDLGKDQVRRRLEYTGFEDGSTFGVIGNELGTQIYKTVAPVVDRESARENHHSMEADDFSNGALVGEFSDEVEINFDEVKPADFVFNHEVDFQAAVRDLAGNIGFSDSDAANPRFINDLGGDDDERKDGPGKHNVLGVFSRHTVLIDELDPYILKDRSVTGFYGTDGDDLVRDRSSVMVVFDNDVEGSLIDTSTFSLEHDEDSPIAITDVLVEGKLVFLKLDEELASDATPTLSITDGREIEDKAGNLLRSEESLYGPDDDDTIKEIEVADGILPVFTVTLSGGSGTGVGNEAATKLTKDAIDVQIDSDENITGSPSVSVVCSGVKFNEKKTKDSAATDLVQEDGQTAVFGLSRFVANRTGTDAETGVETEYDCGTGGATDYGPSRSLSRPGNTWVYAWRNATSDDDDRNHNDGELVVVVWGHDRSSYVPHNSTTGAKSNENWGSATVRFVLDETFYSPLSPDGKGGSVQPENGDEVSEPRPFVTLDFAGELTTVTVTEFMVDGEDALSSLENIGENRFLYWPEALDFGEHKVEFDARDAADNDLANEKTSFTFDVMARDPFVLDITAGWNAISFPADPIDSAVDAVFTEEAVDRVVGWNPTSSTGPWSMASRIDGVWTTNMDFAPLTDIAVRYGYWVHSSAFVKQSVDLMGPISREGDDRPHPIGIITVPGWNFVGVVDQDGDQTEGDAGDPLKGIDDGEPTDSVKAKDYMPGFRQAYTWDAIAHGYVVLTPDAEVKIGDGIWVFFPDQDNIAP